MKIPYRDLVLPSYVIASIQRRFRAIRKLKPDEPNPDRLRTYATHYPGKPLARPSASTSSCGRTSLTAFYWCCWAGGIQSALVMSHGARRVVGTHDGSPCYELFAKLGEGSDATIDEIRQYVDQHPESVRTSTDRGYALHRAVRNRPNDLELITFLVEQHPPALHEKDRDGCLPLHAAIDAAVGVGTIRYLVEKGPRALRVRCSQWGDLPVHCALRADPDAYGTPRARAAVLRCLAEKWPESLEEGTRDGTPPLHLLFAEDAKDDPDPLPTAPEPELVRSLLRLCPASVRKTDGNGRTVLHKAARNPATSLEVIRVLVQEWHGALRARETRMGYLPLHHALEAEMPWTVTKHLIEQWPPSVQEKTETGKIALHYLLLHLRRLDDQDDDDDENPDGGEGGEGESDDDDSEQDGGDDEDDDNPDAVSMVRNLVRRWPQSVREETNEGFVALHLAAHIHMPTSVLRYLVRQWRGSVRAASRKGWLPLHRAVEHGASLRAIRFLVRQFPQSVRLATNKGGLLPLHLALVDEAPPGTVQFLVRQWPHSLQVETRDGSIALHLAVSRPDDFNSNRSYWLNVTRFLVEQHPPSVHVTNRASLLPLHLAAASQAAVEVVRLLVEHAPASAMARDPDGCLPIHLASSRGVPSVELVRYLADHSPLSVRTPDPRGLLPLHKSLTKRDPAWSFWRSQLPVVRVLVDAFPASLLAQDDDGRIPLLVAAESDASLDVLLYLLTKNPLSIRGRVFTSSRTKRPRLR
jgi:Ankyrin repeats (many copies)/Ankyrin repeats (3 copies)